MPDYVKCFTILQAIVAIVADTAMFYRPACTGSARPPDDTLGDVITKVLKSGLFDKYLLSRILLHIITIVIATLECFKGPKGTKKILKAVETGSAAMQDQLDSADQELTVIREKLDVIIERLEK
jgi:hypothetical protein